MLRFRISATLILVAHTAVALVHDLAHRDLGIELSEAQTTYINLVIVAAPVVAVILVWTRLKWAGAILFAFAMAGSLLFGLYHHYLFVSPDHVSHLPEGDLQSAFQITASLLALLEALGVAVGIWGIILGRGSEGKGPGVPSESLSPLLATHRTPAT